MNQPTKPENRLGRFRIAREILQNDWHNLILLFGSFVVVQAQHHWDTSSVEYLAYSQLFDEIDRNTVAPLYELELANMPEGTVALKAIRVKE